MHDLELGSLGRDSQDGQLTASTACQFSRRLPARCGHVNQLRVQPLHSFQSIPNGGPLFFPERNLLHHSLEVGPRLQQLRPTGLFWNVELALGAHHAVLTLLEEVVGAVTMSQIIILPWLTLERSPVLITSWSMGTFTIRRLRSNYPAPLYDWASLVGMILA